MKLLLFDLDGTIIDSALDLHNSLNIILEKHGRDQVSLDDTISYIGNGIRSLLKKAGFDSLNGAEFDVVFEDFLTVYGLKCCETVVLYDGFVDVVDFLKDNTERYKASIITNKPHDATVKILKHFNILEHFDPCYGGDSFDVRKPHPLPLIKAMEKHGITPANTIMIGDSDIDIEAGQRACVNTIYCSYGYGQPNDFTPDHRIDHLKELLQLLDD